MHNPLAKLKQHVWFFVVAQIIVLILLHGILKEPFGWIDGLFLLTDMALLVTVFELFETNLLKRNLSISKVLGDDAHQAFLFGEIGILTYDTNLNVTWANEFLTQRMEHVIGKQISSWLPETQALFGAQADRVVVNMDAHTYEISKKEEGQTLFFRDVTDLYSLRDLATKQQLVIGYVHLDNYEETALNSDDRITGMIDTNIRQRVIEWARSQGILVRRLRTNRLMLVLNQSLFEKLVDDNFSILNAIHDEAAKLDVAISLSIGIGKGSSDILMLDELAINALELAQSRGGDQVAVKAYDQDVEYIGSGSQAQEKRSKVRARIMAQTLRDLIVKSDNVILVGHKEMDFDCLGSALAMANIVRSNGKEAFIVYGGGIEDKLSRAFEEYRDALTQTNTIVNEEQALALALPQSLIIMLDHHNAYHSSVPGLITKNARVAVIDHHRRNQDFTFNPTLVYTETSASSCSEMVSEMIPYQPKHQELTKEEATMILTGILIDTNRFRNRTGSRTFEVASMLKQYGAEPITADAFLKDDARTFELKAKLLNNVEINEHHMAITVLRDEEVSRSIMSQTADMMLGIREVEASFVVAMIDANEVAISARSNGNVNVHVIMEKMNGGGHYSAAGLQRYGTSVDAVLTELKQVIHESMTGKESHENHPAE